MLTINTRDFVRLLNEEIFRQSGMTWEEQWDALLPVIKHAEASGGDNFLVNKLVEILAQGSGKSAKSRQTEHWAMKTVQELMRHANSRLTLDVYAQALTPAKLAAHLKVVEMIRPIVETEFVPTCSYAQVAASVSG